MFVCNIQMQFIAIKRVLQEKLAMASGWYSSKVLGGGGSESQAPYACAGI